MPPLRSFSRELSNEDEDDDEGVRAMWPIMEVFSCHGLVLEFLRRGIRGMHTVTMSAFSRSPRFEPAKTQRRERMNAVRAKRKGIIAGRRMTARMRKVKQER